MEVLERARKLTATVTTTTTTLVTNVPKREESRAKRHFDKNEIDTVKRWQCKYCVTNYGLTTSTSSLWKHLEHKHKDKLSSEDIKQKSGHEIGEKSNKTKLLKSGTSGFSPHSTSLENCESDSNGSGSRCYDLGSDIGERQSISLLDARKRKFRDIERLPDSGSNAYEVVPKKHFADKTQRSFEPFDQQSPDTSTGSDPNANSTSIGFLNLVTDIATIQPAQFEGFQDLLVQNVFLQPSGPYIFPNVDNVDIMRDRILSTQRNRVIDIVGQQCGWKFDMNIYPIFLKEKTYLILDLIYRNKKQLHQSCFLDCLEMPDKYPTEMLSLMIFRRLCEFRVETRLWQLFIGDASLKGLAETLRKIFLDNKLTDEFAYQTVDFLSHNFTVQTEEHNECLNDLMEKVDECIIQLETLKFHLASPDQLLYARHYVTNLSLSTDVGPVITPADIEHIEDQLESLRISGGHFQKDMESIRWWFKRHLFLAYHLCNHCYYLCSDVKCYRDTVKGLAAKLNYLTIALSNRDSKREQWLSAGELQNYLTHWKDTLLWWKRKSQDYQELRHKVLNFVSSNDSTSIFTQQLSKMSQTSPRLIPNDRWMKYTFWQIWKNFEKNDFAK